LYFGLSSHEQTYVARELCRDQAKNFNTLVEYLGLSDEIVVPVEETDEIVPTEIVPSNPRNLIYTALKLLFRKTENSQFIMVDMEGINMFMKIFTNKGLYL
jgi:hypothetical protein